MNNKRRRSTGKASRTVSLFLVLLGTWIMLSGEFTTLHLGSGLVASLLIALLAVRTGMVESESHPIHGIRMAITFWPWLLKEIVIANIDVARCVLHPRLPISPRLVKVPFKTVTELGTVIYANSITLTPGTVTVLIEQNEFLVHALTNAGAQSLLDGQMHERIRSLE